MALGVALAALAACGPRDKVAASFGEPVTVRYVANAGFLVESARTRILIDALFRDGAPGYPAPPEELRAQLERAEPPFAGVDLVLVTHAHPDHFDVRALSNHLASNAAASLVAPPGCIATLDAAYAGHAPLDGRLWPAAPRAGEPLQLALAGVDLRVLRLPHSGDDEHVGYLVIIGGKRLLFLGDAEPRPKDFAELRLAQADVHVAFAPYWLLLHDAWRDLVATGIAPERVVVTHLPAREVRIAALDALGGADGVRERIRTAWPDAILLERPLESIRFE